VGNSFAKHAAVLAVVGLLELAQADPAAAQRRRLVIPEETVIRLELQEGLSSRTADEGDRVTARLDEDDTSGFPIGTRFEGVVTEVRRAADDRPALVDMQFRRAILPDGRVERLDADLASLADEDIRRTDEGRIVSRQRDGGFDWKWVGYGAAGGAVLGEIFGDDFLKGGLLGGLGGAIYGYLNRDRDGDFSEVRLDPGIEFGIRLDRQVAFNEGSGYRYSARDRVLGARDEFRMDTAEVYIDGQPVRFTDARPMRVNGVVYLPLRPLAEAARWGLRHRAGSDGFALRTDNGTVRGSVGDRSVARDGRSYALDAAPMLIAGEVYVPMEYLSRVTDTRVDWNRRMRRVDLRTR
jgi:hypothetical protein